MTVAAQSSAVSISLSSALSGNVAPLASGSSLPYGTPVLIHVAVAGASSCTQNPSSPATGMVMVTDNGMKLDGGMFPLNNGGCVDVETGIGAAPPVLTVGSHSFQASYGGDVNYGPSQTSSGTALTVTPAPTTLTVTSSTSIALSGSQVQLTATVTTTSAGPAPTGTISFSSNSISVSGTPQTKPSNGLQPEVGKPGAVNASLTQTIPYSPTTISNITASYPGDGNYAASTATDSTPITIVPFLLASGNSTAASAVQVFSPGGTGTSSITEQIGTGTASVQLFCMVSPAVQAGEPTCSLSPDSPIQQTSTISTNSVKLFFTTTTGSSTTAYGGLRRDGRPVALTGIFAACLALVLLVGSKASRRYAAFVGVLLLAGWGLLACGQKTTPATSSGTPAGMYMVTVYGTPSGAQPITVYFNVQ